MGGRRPPPPTSLHLPITCPSTKAVGGWELCAQGHGLGEQAAGSLCTQHRTKDVNDEVMNEPIN